MQRANIETHNCGLGDRPGSFEIQIKKNHAGFTVGDFDMEYEIRKPSEFMEV